MTLVAMFPLLPYPQSTHKYMIIDIFNQNAVILASGASCLSNKACIGCPWVDFAKYIPSHSCSVKQSLSNITTVLVTSASGLIYDIIITITMTFILVQVWVQSSFSMTSKALDKLISLLIKTTFPTVTAANKGSNGAEFLVGKKDCAVHER
ncbi:hypothetical protein BDQ17DRAFT_1337989 [Cyathus striatus]|nr:hypothetical protein BDQ17DRAFT_1337989 [Cyathus striatus]